MTFVGSNASCSYMLQTGFKMVAFPDKEMLQSVLQQGMYEQMATTYIIDIGKVLRNGTLLNSYFQERTASPGKVRFDDFAQEFAFVYNA